MGVVRQMACTASRQEFVNSSYISTTAAVMASCGQQQQPQQQLRQQQQQQQHIINNDELKASYQLSQILAAILAQKLNNTSGSGGGLQEKSQQQRPTIKIDEEQAAQLRKSAPSRRYSNAQDGKEVETFDSNSIIEKFNSSLTFSSQYQQRKAVGDGVGDNDPDPRILQRYFGRRRSSPDVATLSQLRSAANVQLMSGIMSKPVAEESSPEQTQTPSSALSSSLTPAVAKIDKSASYSNLQSAAAMVAANKSSPLLQVERKSVQESTVDPPSSSQPPCAPSAKPSTTPAKTTFSSSKGYGILSKTRQFGAWLTKATEGEKIEVSKKDLNAFAPTSF